MKTTPAQFWLPEAVVTLLATCIEASGELLLDLWALDLSTCDPGGGPKLHRNTIWPGAPAQHRGSPAPSPHLFLRQIGIGISLTDQNDTSFQQHL